MTIYHYINLAPWEEKNIPKLPNLILDNQDTHKSNWERLIEAIEKRVNPSSLEVRLRSLIDICEGRIGPFLQWMQEHKEFCDLLRGMDGESLHWLIARYPKESNQYKRSLLKWKGVRQGKPLKAKFISQRKALEALRDNRTGAEAARSLGICYVLLHLIAKGQRGIPTPIEELAKDDLLKWIPSKENPRQVKRLVVA